MHPEEMHGLSKFYFQAEDGEMKPINGTVSEVHLEPSEEAMEVFLGPRATSITGTFNSNIRNLSPSLAKYFKRVRGLGHVYVDDIRNIF